MREEAERFAPQVHVGREGVQKDILVQTLAGFDAMVLRSRRNQELPRKGRRDGDLLFHLSRIGKDDPQLALIGLRYPLGV